MNDQNDQQLLRSYAEQKSDSAFAALVERYVDLVHSAALRMSGDPHSAKDITQCVFVALSQNARQLTDRPTLAGWLHNTARNLTVKEIRSHIRRRTREQEAAAMNELLNSDSTANWEEIAPHLDAALGELSEPERDALLLRYFKNEDLRTVGATFGITDDAAQKRVSRAVERLREFFAKRGIPVGASGIAVAVSANAVQAAPVGLALAISTALTGTTLAATTTVTAAKTVAMTALQKTVVTTTIAVLVGVGVYEAHQASQLRQQTRALQIQQASLAEQLQQLANQQETNQLAAADANSSPKTDANELLRLRATVAKLRREAEELSAASKDAMIFQASVLDVLSNTPPIRTFVATAVVSVPWDQTVATGGWKTPNGKRALVLATVQRGENADQVSIKSRIIEYTEAGEKELGISNFLDENYQTPKGIITLDAKQAADFLGHIGNSSDISLTTEMTVITLSGRQAQIQSADMRQTPSGEKYSTGPIIHYVPTISGDRQSLQLVMLAQLNYRIPLPIP